MTSPVEVMDRLDALAVELNQRSNELILVERDLEPVAAQYEKFVSDHELGLWHRSQTEDGFKLPAEQLRLRMAEADMPAELLGKHQALLHSRKRLEQRIRDIKAQVDAQRSILSALKVEMEASGAGLGRAA